MLIPVKEYAKLKGYSINTWSWHASNHRFKTITRVNGELHQDSEEPWPGKGKGKAKK